jgi:YD repeat-containing protein
MKILAIFFCALALIFQAPCKAQSVPNDPLKVPEVIPKSPEAASLGRYGEVPVSEYTGIPEITIPLHIVKIGDIEVPISLSYYAGGIKVDQEATNVGLGWNLIAGGCINYVPVGGDERIHHLNTYYPIPSWIDWAEMFSYFSDPDCAPFVGGGVNYDGTNKLNGHLVNNDMLSWGAMGDGEPDIYSVNFLNYSFKFFLRPDNPNIPVFVGKKNACKIERTGIDFIITDEDGIKYYFTEEENNVDLGATDCWYLKEIIDLKGNHVTFNYANYGSIYPHPTLSENIGIVTSPDPSATDYGIFANGATAEKRRNLNEGNRAIINKYLTEIITENESVKFANISGREDINGDGAKKLNSITVIDNICSGDSVKKYLLHFDWFTASDDAIGGDYLTDDIAHYWVHYHPPLPENLKKRLKLTGITSVNPHNILDVSEEYVFEYYETYPLPKKTSFARDFWGFYNGQANASTLIPAGASHTLIPNGYALSIIEDDYADMPDYLKIHNGANRFMSRNCVKAGMLRAIKYPTGGKTVFEFEPHHVSNQNYIAAEDINLIGQTGLEHIGGGVRIKKITNYDKDGTTILSIKEYSYTLSNGGTSAIYITPQLNYKTDGYVKMKSTGYLISGIRHILSADNQVNLAISGSSANVGYNRVVIEQKTTGGYNNGKEIKYFNNNTATVVSYKSFLFESTNGDLLQRVLLSADNDTVRVENYAYSKSYMERERLNAIIVNRYYGSETETSIEDRWNILAYLNYNFFNQLKSKETIDYLQDKKISSLTEYIYNKSNQIIIESTNSSKEGMILSKYMHPDDFTFQVCTDAYNQNMQANIQIRASCLAKYYSNCTAYYACVEPKSIAYTACLQAIDFLLNGYFECNDEPAKWGCGWVVIDANAMASLFTGGLIPYESVNPSYCCQNHWLHPYYNKAQACYQQYASLVTACGQTPSSRLSQCLSDDIIDVDEAYNSCNEAQKTNLGTYAKALSDMTDANCLSAVVEKQVWKGDDAESLKLYSAKFIKYDDVITDPVKKIYKPKFVYNYVNLDPAPIDEYVSTKYENVNDQNELVLNSYYKPEINYDKFDQIKSNLLQYHKENDMNVSYIWGYNNSLPIAEVKNASCNEVFFTSYEQDVDFGSSTDHKYIYISHTGKQCDKLSSTDDYAGVIDFNVTNLTHSKYRYSAWFFSYGTSVMIVKDKSDANPSLTVDIPTGGQWRYFEKVFEKSSFSGVTEIRCEIRYTGGTKVYVDDVRFQPVDAQMTTYTYDPLVGISSITDPRNQSTKYEYDEFGRLEFIKDYNGNILQKYDYHYAP